MHNTDNNIIILWDMAVSTDRTITANKLNIVVKDLTNATCKPIDMTVPSDRNIALNETEKKSKHKDLELEIQRMWHMRTEVIPVKKVSERATVTEMQKICMLGSAQILRKVLSSFQIANYLHSLMEQATFVLQNLKEDESFPYLSIHNCLFLIHVFIFSVI